MSGDLLKITFALDNETYQIEQNEIDPCAFRVVKTSAREVSGMLFIHVDDIMAMGEEKVLAQVKTELNSRFPVDEWEENRFEYVGCEYQVSAEEVFINQTVYTQSRASKISIPAGADDDDMADESLFNAHRSAVGCLSWLAKQIRPDLQFSVAQAQRAQGKPTIKDIKDINKLVDLAVKYKDKGVTLKKTPEHKLAFYAFHDAAWGNVHADDGNFLTEEWDGNFTMGSRLGSLVMVGDEECLRNREANFSMIDWKSKASTRVCRSTFAGETMACGDAVESALYLRGILASFMRGRLIPENEAGEVIPLHLFTDCKSLFDHLRRDGVPRPPSVEEASH